MTSFKQVTIVGPLPPPAGGMANQTRKLAEFLKQEGLEVDVVQVNRPYFPSFIGKLPIVRAGFRLVRYIIALVRQLGKADIVHIMANSGWSWHLYAAPAIWIAKVLGKPVVLNYRGGYAKTFFDKSWFWVKPSVQQCQKILVPSVFLQEVFAEFHCDAEIVPNVIDQHVFYPHSKSRVSEHPHIIVTRNLEGIYDVATAIRGFSIVHESYPDATMSVAGTGPELSMLTALAQSLGIAAQVKFVGRLSPSEIAELYRSADIMVNTSIVDNSPNSIIESLACGTPVVSSNVGGIPKMVNHDHDAILIAPEQPELVAEGIIRLLKDPELYKKIQQNGQFTVSKFYWNNVWECLQAHYQEAAHATE